MNAFIGYDKVVIFNNTLPNNDAFNLLYKRHKRSVDIVPINYLPNILKRSVTNQTYFRHMEELTLTGHEYSGESILYGNLIIMAINECLLSYSDKADLMLVIDNDEVFIPPKLSRFENDQMTFAFLSQNDLNSDEKVVDFQKVE